MALKRSDRMTRLDAGARLLLATAYIRLGRQHWARAELEDLVHSSPTDPRYRLALARLHYEDQRFSEAAELVRPVIASEPGLAEAHDLLGQCLEGLGEVDAAKRAYAAAISLSARAGRRDAWPHYHLGSLLHDLGELEASRDVLRAAVERDPANGAALWALGIVLDKLDDLDGARSALEAAARASPQNGRIQYSIARVYRRLGLAERANAAMERFRAFANPPR